MEKTQKTPLTIPIYDDKDNINKTYHNIYTYTQTNTSLQNINSKHTEEEEIPPTSSSQNNNYFKFTLKNKIDLLSEDSKREFFFKRKTTKKHINKSTFIDFITNQFYLNLFGTIAKSSEFINHINKIFKVGDVVLFANDEEINTQTESKPVFYICSIKIIDYTGITLNLKKSENPTTYYKINNNDKIPTLLHNYSYILPIWVLQLTTDIEIYIREIIKKKPQQETNYTEKYNNLSTREQNLLGSENEKGINYYTKLIKELDLIFINNDEDSNYAIFPTKITNDKITGYKKNKDGKITEMDVDFTNEDYRPGKYYVLFDYIYLSLCNMRTNIYENIITHNFAPIADVSIKNVIIEHYTDLEYNFYKKYILTGESLPELNTETDSAYPHVTPPYVRLIIECGNSHILKQFVLDNYIDEYTYKSVTEEELNYNNKRAADFFKEIECILHDCKTQKPQVTNTTKEGWGDAADEATGVTTGVAEAAEAAEAVDDVVNEDDDPNKSSRSESDT
jgi:hypothetical protein